MSDDDQHRAPTRVGLPAMNLRRPVTEPSTPPPAVPDRVSDLERRLAQSEARVQRLERKVKQLSAARNPRG